MVLSNTCIGTHLNLLIKHKLNGVPIVCYLTNHESQHTAKHKKKTDTEADEVLGHDMSHVLQECHRYNMWQCSTDQ
jgi:hypothetical protein